MVADEKTAWWVDQSHCCHSDSGYLARLRGRGLIVREQRQRNRKQESARNPEFNAVNETLAYLQVSKMVCYGERDPEVFRSKLLKRANALDTIRNGTANQAVRSIVDSELAIAYTNLAVLNERVGNAAEAQRYMRSAKDMLNALGWNDTSDAVLKSVAKAELDKWNCGSREQGESQ